MKHVWIINHYAQIPGGPGGTRHFHLAQNLLKYGWSTSIIASSLEHKTGKQRLEKNEKVRLEKHDDVRFLWIKTGRYSNNGIARVLNIVQFTFSALVRKNTKLLPEPDVIIGSSVHPFAAWAGMRLSKHFRVPFVFEVRDLWPQTLISMGKISHNGLAASFFRRLEKRLYYRAKKIIILLPNASEYIRTYGINKKKFAYIPNGVNLDHNDFSAVSDNKESFTFMYFGAHGQANDLGTIIKAFSIVNSTNNQKHIRLRLIGSGPAKEELKELSRKLQVDNILFEEAVSKEKIPFIASQADAFVITVKNLPDLYRYGISMNKIFDYMAAARPIIIAAKAANNPIEEAQCGITVDPEKPSDLAKAMVNIANSSSVDRETMGIAARRYVEKYHNYSTLSKQLAETLNMCV